MFKLYQKIQVEDNQFINYFNVILFKNVKFFILKCLFLLHSRLDTEEIPLGNIKFFNELLLLQELYFLFSVLRV